VSSDNLDKGWGMEQEDVFDPGLPLSPIYDPIVWIGKLYSPCSRRLYFVFSLIGWMWLVY
jgi:hypothetical protein